METKARARRKPAPAASSSTDRVTAYAQAVTAGEIVAGPSVRDACARHLRDLEDGHERGLLFDLARLDNALAFFEEVLRLNGGEYEGEPFLLQPWQAFIIGSLFGWVDAETGFRRFRTAYIEIGKGNGKALDIHTPIPTPHGWSTMGELEVGDEVFDERGEICRITAATPVMIGRPCYRVTFNDGHEIVADALHQWRTTAMRNGGRRGPKPTDEPRKGCAAIRTTEEIARTLTVRPSHSAHPQAKWNHRVDVAGALATPEADLTIPPYTLGVWLGDGDSDCARFTMAFADGQIAEEVVADGTPVSAQRRHSETTGRFLMGGRRAVTLSAQLRTAGLFGNKHIPEVYLRASEAQRLALLQGLMDTDGYASEAQSSMCEFTTVSERLRDGVMELLASLGFKPMLCTARATLYGRDVGPKYRIQFHAYRDRPVFRLARKMARLRDRPKSRPISQGRMIVGCDPIESVPVRCIEVDSPSHLFLAGRGMIPTHNSPLAAGVGLYMLTADGEARAEVYAAASKKDQAMVLFRDAVAMVDQSPDLHSRLLQTGGMRPWNLTYLPLHSFFRAISSDEGQSGPRPHCSLVDEVHEHKNSNVVDMLKAGHKGRRQPLMVEITNSGFDRKSVCYAHHEYSIEVGKGEKVDDEWFGFVCDLDKGDDPLKDESCWIKVNPNLGVSIDRKYLRGQVRQALGMPSQMSLVKRLNFCMWVDAANPWISGELWMKAERDFEEESIDLLELEEIVGALDLSGSLDLTALALGGVRKVPVPKLDETTGLPIEIGEGKFEMTEIEQMLAMVEFWTPRDTLRERDQRDKTNYSLWVDQGFMTAPPGRNIDYGWVAFRLGELQALYPKFRRLCFDTYRIKYLEKELDELNIELELVPHPQGYYKAVEQSPEEVERLLRAGQKPKIALWMPRSVELLEAAVAEERLLVNRNPCLTSCSASAVLEPDPKNNRIFTKRKSTGRIDGIVALAMATGFAFQAPPALPPARIGFV